MKYEAVIFDLDGTLLNTLDDLADSMNAVLSRFGFPMHEVEKYKYFIGNGVDNLVRAAMPEENHDETTIKLCVSAMREEYSSRWADKTKVYEGVPELLGGLYARCIKTAILSNKPDDFTKIMAARLLSGWRFEVVFGQRPSVPKKPNPSAAFEIARILDIPAQSILYLGDSDTDMLMANAAGMYAVGALWGFRTSAELLSGGAKLLVEKPVELLKFFN